MVRLAITCGDPYGIGPEVALKALRADACLARAQLHLFGDRARLARVARELHLPRRWFDALPIHDVPVASRSARVVGGPDSAVGGRAALACLEAALALWDDHALDGLVTAPISKAAIYKAGSPFPGHTEWLAARTRAAFVAMMLLGGPLKVVPVTRHVPLAQVSRRLSVRAVAETIRLTGRALTAWFGRRHPVIAVAGLNPHGGEGGYLGHEERRIIQPAIRRARHGAWRLIGPLAPDAAMHACYHRQVDAVVCMYHDQALIPVKMIARDAGVNLTLGLPFVRTSPDHGTAYDIAGKGIADAGAMRSAIQLALRLCRTQSSP